MKRKLGITGSIIGILIVLKLVVGIYEDDEFPEKHLFIKHRPIWQTYFYSPRGLSDLKHSEMSVDRQKEQLLYDEFVLKIIPNEDE